MECLNSFLFLSEYLTHPSIGHGNDYSAYSTISQLFFFSISNFDNKTAKKNPLVNACYFYLGNPSIACCHHGVLPVFSSSFDDESAKLSGFFLDYTNCCCHGNKTAAWHHHIVPPAVLPS